MERLIYVMAILGPFTAVPQAFEIWFVDKTAAGVSFSTWAMFLATSVIWLGYGVMRRDRPVIICNALWCVMDVIIMIGAARFSSDWL